MSFTAWAHSHARSILFLLGALALAGAVASFSLPVALFPYVDFPRVRITLDAGDRPAEQMTIEVTVPVEEAVRAIPAVPSVTPTTSPRTPAISANLNPRHHPTPPLLPSPPPPTPLLPPPPPPP